MKNRTGDARHIGATTSPSGIHETRLGHIDTSEHRRDDEAGERVHHLYPVRDLEIALELGVDVQAFCGVWSEPSRPTSIVEKVRDPEERAWAVPRPRDCQRCVAALEASWTAAWKASRR